MLRHGWSCSVQVASFGFSLTKGSLVNSTNIDNQLLFSTGSPNCTPSTFLAGGNGNGGLVGEGVVGKCIRDAFKKKKSKLWDIGPKGGRGSKQNPKC